MANDKLRIALLGSGGMGQGDTKDAVIVPGVEIAAAADICDSRLDKMKETLSRHLHHPRLSRSPGPQGHRRRDHRHARPLALPASPSTRMQAGKDVYCEKPMVQQIEDGKRVIAAPEATGRIFQVGSQYVSSPSYQKARELLQPGAIGELNMVEAWLDRNTAIGAWQYSIPPDASPANIDWDRFLGNAPKRPFEPIRLFRWRNYRDYGTGVAGDCSCTSSPACTSPPARIGPKRIYATGGLRYWKDGRDVPDVMIGVIDLRQEPSAIRSSPSRCA